MTLKFFYENYNINDLDIKNIKIENNKLIIDAYISTYLELIANGYRPELDISNKIKFIFNVDLKNKNYNNPKINDIKYENNVLYLYINDDEIVILDDNLEVHKN